jgi:glycosyltransferase A (GT-A) superfamily protein (DUF2064 family)
VSLIAKEDSRTTAKHSPPSIIDDSVSHTAVLFFSHRPDREWQNKEFVRRDYAKHRQVAEVLYDHSRRAVQDSGLPVLEVTDEHQRGNGFAERFTNAVADAFAQGYEQVIAVGSDCPRLHEVDWQAVAGRLESGTPVLGPTADREGAYLIGLRREHFDQASFEALPWTSPGLFSSLARYLERRAGAVPAVLAVRDDVNSHRELVALVRGQAAVPTVLLARLYRVLGRGNQEGSDRERTSHRHVIRRRSRAPPFHEHTLAE